MGPLTHKGARKEEAIIISSSKQHQAGNGTWHSAVRVMIYGNYHFLGTQVDFPQIPRQSTSSYSKNWELQASTAQAQHYKYN